MPTHLPQNQFITDSVTSPSPTVTYTAGASPPPHAPAGIISVSDGGPKTPSETEGAVSVSAASSDNHIHEIFHYARKLLEGDPSLVGFVLDEAAFMADVEEIPLFIRDGDHLRRQA